MCVMCLLAWEVPWALHVPCKMMKWRDQRDHFEAEGKVVRAFAHTQHPSWSITHTIWVAPYICHNAYVITHTYNDPLGSPHENSRHTLVPCGGTWRGIRPLFSWLPEERPLIPGQDWANISSRHTPHTALIKTAKGAVKSHSHFQVKRPWQIKLSLREISILQRRISGVI